MDPLDWFDEDETIARPKLEITPEPAAKPAVVVVTEQPQSAAELYKVGKFSKCQIEQKVWQDAFADRHFITTPGPVIREWIDNHYAVVSETEIKDGIRKCLDGYIGGDDGNENNNLSYQNLTKCFKYFVELTGVDPQSLDPERFYNCTNCVLELDDLGRVVQTVPHHPRYRFIEPPGFAYDPGASEEDANKLLLALDDKQRPELLDLWATSLRMHAVREKVGRVPAILQIGGGSNGKDAVTEALRLIHGANRSSCIPINHFATHGKGEGGTGRFSVETIANSRLNIGSESPGNLKIEENDTLKNVITGNQIFVEAKNTKGYVIRPHCLCVFNFNKAPNLGSNITAMSTRFVLLEFERTFGMPGRVKPGQMEADPRFAEDEEWVRQNVLPGLFNMLLRSLQKILQKGELHTPHLSARFLSQQAEDNHLVQAMEEIGARYTGDPNDTCGVGELYNLLLAYYQEIGAVSHDHQGRKIWGDADRNDPWVRNVNGLSKSLRDRVWRSLRTDNARANRKVFVGVVVASQTQKAEDKLSQRYLSIEKAVRQCAGQDDTKNVVYFLEGLQRKVSGDANWND